MHSFGRKRSSSNGGSLIEIEPNFLAFLSRESKHFGSVFLGVCKNGVYVI